MMKSFFCIAFLLAFASFEVSAEPKIVQHISYTSYEDWNAADEGCVTFVKLTIGDGDSSGRDVQLCGAGGYPYFTSYKGNAIAFVPIVGGAANGWGLYRYSAFERKTDRYDFNARKIEIQKQDGKGVWLNVRYAVRNTQGEGYLADRIEQWYWAFEDKVPVKK